MSDVEIVDPLNDRPAEGPDRLNYAQGLLLDDRDFRDEQTYHRGRLARALKYLFGPGTVAGLRVDRRPATGATEEVVVRPGLAIDPLGRLIELPRSACARIDTWWNAQAPGVLSGGFHASPPAPFTGLTGVIVDVFVRFRACGRGKTPAFASGPFDATDALVSARLRDGYDLDLVVRREATPPAPPNTLALAAARDADLTAFRAAVLEGWHEDEADWRDGMPAPLPEHATGQDTRSLLLARLLVPASAGSPPTRLASEPVRIDNDLRRFVYATGVLAFEAP